MINTEEVMVQRLLKINYKWSEERLRNNWRSLPKPCQGLLLDSYFHSDANLYFAFQYVRYYLSTREGRIIQEQFYYSLKYALMVAPLVNELPLGEHKPYRSAWVGDLVEYSFTSIRDKSKPDPSSYELDTLRGAVIIRLFNSFLPTESVDTARTIGTSWELVRDNWFALKGKPLDYIVEYLNHIEAGGSVHLSDGVL